MRKILLMTLFVFVLTMAAYSQAPDNRLDSRDRGIYFEVGIGFAGINYTDEVDDEIELLDGLGADRTTVFLDIGLGYAVSPKAYIVGSISGIGDRLSYDNEYLQINTYLYGAGIRYYPFTTGLQLGADIGLSKIILDSSDEATDNSSSDTGFGSRFTLAYDFDSTLTGPAALIGGSLLISNIDDSTIRGMSLFVNFLFK